jgi:pyridoxal phosphate enzyme (YggS family)
LRDFGENYLQEFEGKYPEVSDLAGARFHLIGHLQSNKAKKAADLFQTVQTVDTEKLARRLDAVGKPLDVMLEVKLSPEESKSGAEPAELPALIAAVRSCPNLHLLGLMTMPPWSDDPELSRPYFRRLKELAIEHGLQHLSMGCRTIWRSLSKKARLSCVWEPRCSAKGRSPSVHVYCPFTSHLKCLHDLRLVRDISSTAPRRFRR